jgi:hypothetical protein
MATVSSLEVLHHLRRRLRLHRCLRVPLLAWLLASPLFLATAADAQEPAEVYAAVLSHIGRLDAGDSIPVGLDTFIFDNCIGGCGQGAAPHEHPPEVLDRLSALGVVAGIDERAPGALSTLPGRWVGVRLGPVLDLPADSRVKLLPDRARGTPDQLDAIPDSLAVPVDFAVDVVITTPCPAPAGSFRCRVPDTTAYRYFLRARSTGGVEVLTRWYSGAI